MADWAERRGFRTTIVERPFRADFQVSPHEPALALCGVDNPLARSALEDVGFEGVIEAGLGSGTSDFLGFRTHVFPGARVRLATCGKHSGVMQDNLTLISRLTRNSLPPGLMTVASRNLRDGLLARRLSGPLRQLLWLPRSLRMVNGAHGYSLVDGHLRDLAHLTAVKAQEQQFFNPGTAAALCN